MKIKILYIAIFMAILAGYLFLNKKELPSSHKVTLEKKSAIIEEKNFIYDNKDKEKKQNNESKNIPLSKIIDTQVKEPDATKLWNILQNSDFNSSDTIEILDELFFARGAFKYYKELIEIANNKKISDEVLANLITGIFTAYEGDRHNENASISFNKKDEILQQFLTNQLTNPQGKESYFMALERIDYITAPDEIQAKMDSLLESDNLPIEKSDIYALKLRFSLYTSTSMSSEEELFLLEKVSNMDSIENPKLQEGLYNFAYKLQNSENKELVSKYQEILENNPIKVEERVIEPDNSNIPIFANDEELQAYADEYITPQYEEKRNEFNEEKNQYARYIEAYSFTLNSFDEKVDFYKSKIKNGNKAEQEAILYMLEENADLNEDSDRALIEQLRADSDLEGLFE